MTSSKLLQKNKSQRYPNKEKKDKTKAKERETDP
jgi:hypothetical protein